MILHFGVRPLKTNKTIFRPCVLWKNDDRQDVEVTDMSHHHVQAERYFYYLDGATKK